VASSIIFVLFLVKIVVFFVIIRKFVVVQVIVVIIIIVVFVIFILFVVLFLDIIGNRIQGDRMSLRYFQFAFTLGAAQDFSLLYFVFINIKFCGTIWATEHGSNPPI